jgi:uncharacterized BrkB/YihY/UPF0761 family membrane protein
LAIVLIAIARTATSKQVAVKKLMVGAGIAAIIMQLLVSFGGILVAHELKNMGAMYGTFAIVLGLLFWLYLLAQVLVYSAEIDTVRALKLWPRSITPEHQTAADQQAYSLYARAEQYGPKAVITAKTK